MPYKKTSKRISLKYTLGDKIANLISWFFGSWWAIFLHVIWFSFWIYFKFSIELLTLIVSLEAIFLVIILLMYSNLLAHRDDARDEADYQADIKSASEIMKVKNELKLLRHEIRKINKIK